MKNILIALTLITLSINPLFGIDFSNFSNLTGAEAKQIANFPGVGSPKVVKRLDQAEIEKELAPQEQILATFAKKRDDLKTAIMKNATPNEDKIMQYIDLLEPIIEQGFQLQQMRQQLQQR